MALDPGRSIGPLVGRFNHVTYEGVITNFRRRPEQTLYSIPGMIYRFTYSESIGC